MPVSNACAAKAILLWIHEGLVVTVCSSVLCTDHLDLYLKDQGDRSTQDNRVGVGGPAILVTVGQSGRAFDHQLRAAFDPMYGPAAFRNRDCACVAEVADMYPA
jgi:hypothetical protein